MHQALILDVQLRVELQQIIDRLAGRGDAVLVAILTSAINTIDHRLDHFQGELLPADDAPVLVEPVLNVCGRDLKITIERDFWLLFEELRGSPATAAIESLERSLDNCPDEGLVGRVAAAIRLLVLHRVLDGQQHPAERPVPGIGRVAYEGPVARRI